VWSHPDLLPTTGDLDDPAAWVAARVAGEGADDVDRELRELLERPIPPGGPQPDAGSADDTNPLT
jgi:hypothetical protein